MSMSLVQSALGGNASGTFTSGAGGSATATGNFGSNTTAGNLLICVVYLAQHRTSGLGFAPATTTPTTSGITWSASILSAGPGDIGADRNGSQIFACGNAPSVSSGTSTSVTYSPTASSANGTMAVEFALYEFSGIAKVANYTTGSGLIDNKLAHNSGVGGTPDPGNLTTTKTDLLFAWFRGNSSNISAGSGYTLGQSMTVVTVGQAQYRLDVAAGTIATAFSGGTEANWGASVVAFQAPPVTANSSYGFFFG